MRECDAAKLMRATVQGLVPIPAVGDAYFMYPQRWAPLVLAYGSIMQGRGGIGWLQAHSKYGASSSMYFYHIDTHTGILSLIVHQAFEYLFMESNHFQPFLREVKISLLK